MEWIPTYFPGLTGHQQEQFERLIPLYAEWNERINVISRKDMEHLELHHVLHSLAIGKFLRFRKDTHVLDLGTGGGFPGIPLAILFPDVRFTLIDGTGKKIKVVNAVAEAIGLDNVRGIHIRAEEVKEQADFVVSRAVAELSQLWQWSYRLIHTRHHNALPNGLICLKGGNIREEIKAMPRRVAVDVEPVSRYFSEPYFQEKHLVYLQR